LKEKIKPLSELVKIRKEIKEKGQRVVFTNGVFDLLHRGHVEYLAVARARGDFLIIGLNSDSSVRQIKGALRPIVKQEDRAMVLAGLSSVDYICFFNEETPYNIINSLQPDILVKGGDYELDEIVGRDIVENSGGKVITIPITKGMSTSNIIKKIKEIAKYEENTK
jgi:rfaE bifunctional protein nucleotidyltransferase chain/domain